jgi:hypothetical protein
MKKLVSILIILATSSIAYAFDPVGYKRPPISLGIGYFWGESSIDQPSRDHHDGEYVDQLSYSYNAINVIGELSILKQLSLKGYYTIPVSIFSIEEVAGDSPAIYALIPTVSTSIAFRAEVSGYDLVTEVGYIFPSAASLKTNTLSESIDQQQESGVMLRIEMTDTAASEVMVPYFAARADFYSITGTFNGLLGPEDFVYEVSQGVLEFGFYF